MIALVYLAVQFIILAVVALAFVGMAISTICMIFFMLKTIREALGETK